MIEKNKNQVKVKFGNNDIVMKTKTINSLKTGIIGFLENSPNTDVCKYLTDNGEADATKYPVVMSFPNTKSIDNVIKQLEKLKFKMQNTKTTILSVFPGMEINNLLIYDSCPKILVLCVEKIGKEINHNYNRINIYGGFTQFICEYNKNGIIVVPCYDEVREELKNSQIDYKLVYPDITSDEQKERVMENIKKPFYSIEAENLITKYEESINKLKKDSFAEEKIQLKDGEYLEDIISKYI